MTSGRLEEIGVADADRPRGRSPRGSILGCLVVFALSCGVFAASARVIRLPPAWVTFEFCQYAEIGRNLAEDGTFDTRLVEPMALAAIDRDLAGPRSGRWPVVNRYPLPSVMVAALMRLLGPTEIAAAWSNGLAIGLLAAITYAAARRWFGAGWAAVVALVFLANPSFYGEFVLLGTPDVWFAAIFLLELLAWSSFDPADPRPQLAWASGLGLLGGLAYLGRFNASLFLAVQVVALLGRRRWRESALMVLVSGLVASPMLAYHWHHFHRPFVSIYSGWNLLDRIGATPVEPWLSYRVPDLGRELMLHSGGFAYKFFNNLLIVVPFGLWSLWRLDVLMPLAMIGTWMVGRGTGLRRFASWSLGLFALQLVVFSALRLEFEGRDSPHNGRYFLWFAAPALLMAVGTMARISAGRRWARMLAIVAVVGRLALFGMAWASLVRRHGSAEMNVGRDPIRRMLAEVVGPDRMIASNQPQITAWFCGLRSVSLPADPIELARLNRRSHTPADYVFIDVSFNAIDIDPRWIPLVEPAPRSLSLWEGALLRDYEYAFRPSRTRPIGYVLLRRRGVPPSGPEADQDR